jgi:Spy/CpxP family protein refolding chaperone
MTKSNAKNLSKTVLMLLSVGALVLTAGPAFAQPDYSGDSDGYAPQGRGGKGGQRGRRGKMHGQRMEKMKATLGLSDAQAQQIKAIRAGQRAQRKQYRQQIRPLRKQLKALLSAYTVNEAQVLAVHNQLKSIKQLVGEQRFKTRLAVINVLTQEQRVKMMSMKRGKHGQRGKWGRRGGRGRGAGNGQGNPQSTVY